MSSVKKNYIFNLIYQIIAICIPVLTTPYLSRVMGAKAIGDYNYILGIVSYFGILAASGTVSYAQREIGMAQYNIEKRRVITSEIFVFRIISTLLSFSIFYIYIQYDLGEYTELLMPQVFIFVAWALDISWYFQGIENYRITAIRNSIVKILGTVLIFLLVKSEKDVVLYMWIYIITTLIGNLTMWPAFILKKELVLFDFSKIKKVFFPIIQLFIPVIAIQIYTVLDQTMLGKLCGTVEVGYYSLADKIVKLLLTLLSSLIAVLIPRFSYLYFKNDRESIIRALNKIIKFIFFLGIPLTVGCIGVADDFIPVFLGDGYLEVIPIFKCLSLLFVVLGLGQLFGSVLISFELQNKATIATVVAAVIDLLLNYVFIVCFNGRAFSVAVASIVAEFASFCIGFYYLRDYLDIRNIISVIKQLSLSTIMLSVSLVVIHVFMSGSLYRLIVEIIIGCLAYIIPLIMKKDDLIFELLSLVFKRIRIIKKN